MDLNLDLDIWQVASSITGPFPRSTEALCLELLQQVVNKGVD